MYEDEHLESDYEDRNGSDVDIDDEYDIDDEEDYRDEEDEHDYQDMGDEKINQHILDNRPLADEAPIYYQNDPHTHMYA